VWRKDEGYHPFNTQNIRADNLTTGNVIANLGDTQRHLRQSANGKDIDALYELQDTNENGDGTVPVRSGRAPRYAVKVCIPYKNFDHEGAFKEEDQRLFSLWAITKIAYQVQNTSMGYGEKC
jgi:hypothetical protein